MRKRTIAVIVACFCTVFAAYAIRYSYGTLLPEMLDSLSITKAQAGIIYSSYFIAYTICSPVMGLLSDRFDIRIILAVFASLMGIGAFLMQYSDSIMEASLYFALVGIGSAACWAPVMAVAQRWTGQRHRGFILALVDAGSTLGVMAAGSLMPLAVAASGWRLGWMSLGLLSVFLGILNYFLIRSSPQQNVRQASGAPAARSRPGGAFYKSLFRDRRFWYIGLAYLLTGFAVMVPFTFLSTYAVQELSYSYDRATLLITIIGIGGLVGKMTLGPVSDKVGRIKTMLLCAVLIAGGCLGILFTGGYALFIIAGVFGAGYGACWSLYANCAADFFSIPAAGGIIGLWTFYLGIGLLASPVAAGWLADATGTLTWSFVTAAAAGLVSMVFLFPMLRSEVSSEYRTSLSSRSDREI